MQSIAANVNGVRTCVSGFSTTNTSSGPNLISYGSGIIGSGSGGGAYSDPKRTPGALVTISAATIYWMISVGADQSLGPATITITPKRIG